MARTDDGGHPPAQRGRIAEAAARCFASFQATATRLHEHREDGSSADTQLTDCLSRYRIWASNLGAWHPRSDERSVDYRLRDVPEVEDRIAELLQELTETNEDILRILSGDQVNKRVEGSDDGSEESGEGYEDSQDELSELWLSVGDIITSLMKVSILVRKATGRDRYLKAASAAGEPFLEDFDKRHVADKFPKAREQPWLIDRLGAAITQRRQFLRYSRDHRHRIGNVGFGRACKPKAFGVKIRLLIQTT